jgi:hypothetical protein
MVVMQPRTTQFPVSLLLGLVLLLLSSMVLAQQGNAAPADYLPNDPASCLLCQKCPHTSARCRDHSPAAWAMMEEYLVGTLTETE